MTQSGFLVGTPEFMAPEQAAGKRALIGPATDIYALGVMLYQLLTGQLPFQRESTLELLRAVTSDEPVRPRRLQPSLPRDLEAIALHCLEKEPARRYPSAQALADDLRRYLAGEPIGARPVPFWERRWKWAKRRPALAALAATLQAAFAALLVLGVVSYYQINRALKLAREDRNRARISSRQELAARQQADAARNRALAETYRASLSEVRALRAGRSPGWRDAALGILARLAVSPAANRNLDELRTEALAVLAQSDVRVVARAEGLPQNPWSLAFSPDSRRLAINLVGSGVVVCDVPQRRVALAVAGSPQAARERSWDQAACFLADGTLAYTPEGRYVAFLDLTSRQAARPAIAWSTRNIHTLSADRRGRWLAVALSEGHVDLLDAATGRLKKSWHEHNVAPALSPDGDRLAMVQAGEVNTVLVYQTDNDRPPERLGQHADSIQALEFSLDGTKLASASWDHTAVLWDVAGRAAPLVLRGHRDTVTGVAFSPDGARVATTGADHVSRIWDARTGQTLTVLPADSNMRGAAFSPDGRYLALSSEQSTNPVTLYELTGQHEQRRLVGHTRGVATVVFHPHRPLLATGAGDSSIALWDARTARRVRGWRAHTSYVPALAFNPDGSLLASGNGSVANDGRYTVQLWDPETGTRRRSLDGHRIGVAAVGFSPSGRRLVTGDESGQVLVWDAETGNVIARQSLGGWVRSAVFCDERQVLAVAGADEVVLFDLQDATATRCAKIPHGWARLLVDARRGRALLAGTSNELVEFGLFDLAVKRRVNLSHDGRVLSLALSPDGGWLATGGDDRRIVLRDSVTFRPLVTFPFWLGQVEGLAFDATGTRLAIVGVDSDAAVWDLEAVHQELAQLQLAWDQPAPAVSSDSSADAAGARTRPEVVEMRPTPGDLLKIAEPAGPSSPPRPSP
jgi:WD40 repeat protein